MDNAIETDELTKSFDRRQSWRWIAAGRPITAVTDVTLTVRRGELFGLLGPNGAGKTTLTKMLCTLIAPSRGQARVAGFPLAQAGAIRAAVGLVVSDERSFYWRLTGRQNLTFFAALHGLHGRAAAEQVNRVLAEVALQPQAEKRFSDYSTGMRQRLAIARSLLHRPQLLFLDEPTRSLDPLATQRLHELIARLNSEAGVTIFLITHDLAEAEKLCRRLAVMHQGRIRAVGTPAELRRLLQPQLHYCLRTGPIGKEIGAQLAQLTPGLRLEQQPDHASLSFRLAENDGRLTAVLDALRRHDVVIQAIESQPPTLEEVFAYFTQTEAMRYEV